MIITISGESGSGKTTVASLLSLSGFERIVTYTSRSPRHGERDAVDYMFKTRTQIEALYASGILWEISEFCGNLYGSPLVDAKNNYCIIVEEIGALAYKAKYQSGCLGVLLTADKSTISRHLEKRGDIKSILSDRRDE